MHISRSYLLFAIFVLQTAASFAAAADKPNFLWVVSEDNSKHYLKLYDEHGIETPNIDRLAQHGLIFEHAFSNAPVCSVARTTLITGCYAPRIGTQFHRRAVEVPMPAELRMFPAYLRDAGYYTTNNDKKDYNATEGNGVWDESSGKASWRNRDKGQPFFHMQTFKNSHEGRLHFTQKEFENRPTQTDPDQVFVAPYHPDTPLFRYTNALYRDRIRIIDEEIGQVVNELQQDGLLEETFIFYFGDHGGVLPRSKGYIYESGLHVPLVVRIPEKFKHLVDADLQSRIDGFVSFIDFGPTLLNLAGIKVPAQMDGQPFLGESVSRKELNDRDQTFGYADRFDEKYDLVRSLRKGKFKYIRSYQPFNFDGLQNNYRYIMLAYQEWRALFQAGKLNDVQSQFFRPRPAEALYDVETDPHETNNLANEPAFKRTLIDLREQLVSRVKSMPDLSMYPESYLAEHAFNNPVAFGKAHKLQIGELVDIADLSLVSLEEARDAITAALDSDSPWKRYWGLISCTTHGKAAAEFFEKAKRIAADDQEPLVRVRAAEFLAIAGAVDPRPVIEQALRDSKSRLEVLLMLNSVVLLQDGYGYTFQIDRHWFGDAEKSNKEDDVERRLLYLNDQRK
jgi:arylsulfatase A-like enzyme